MKRTVYVARTSHDLEHVNRLVAPEYGIVSLNVVAGSASSKSHLPADAPQPASPDSGSDDFHFVPEHETVEIRYEINDRFGLVDEARLEMFTRFDETPLWTLELKTLGADWWAHGKHAVKWDGRIVKAAAEQKGTAKDGGMTHDLTALALDKSLDPFPDGYFSLEHTPYKLKLTLTGDKEARANPVAAWTYWHILVHSLELEIGPEEAIPAATVDDARHKQDKDVRSRIVAKGGIPAAAGSVEVVLLSNVFKTSLGEMDTNAGFTEYETLWGRGPQIPLVAKIRLSDSANAAVKIDETPKGAVALGKAKFLWDWEDPDEDVAGRQGTAAKSKAFLLNAIDYYKDGTDAARSATDHTYPKGDNCHVDRGGKRGPGAQPVFPKQTGYDPADALTAGKFPFKVELCKERLWASLSQGWTRGKLKGKTGVAFEPTRMGGDDYVVTVYLAYDKTAKDKLVLDAKTEPLVAPDKIKKATGKFQIWREVHVARYITKLSTLAALFPTNLGGVQADFLKAYVHVENKMDADNTYALADHRLATGTAPDYNALVRAKLTATGSILFTKDLATDPAADHASVDSMVKVRTYIEFVKKTHLVNYAAVPAAANDLSLLGTALGITEDAAAEGLSTWNGSGAVAAAVKTRLTATKTWLVNNKLDTKVKYSKVLDDWFFGIGEPLAGDLKLVTGKKTGGGKAAPPGVTTLQFNFTNTFLRDLYTAGVGVSYWYGSAIDPGDADRERCVIMFWLAKVDYFSHEFGHHFFLPHAKYPTASPPGGAKEDRHDDVDDGCLMSYSSVRPAFCGLCQLRMRGWSATKLDKISAKNKKP